MEVIKKEDLIYGATYFGKRGSHCKIAMWCGKHFCAIDPGINKKADLPTLRTMIYWDGSEHGEGAFAPTSVVDDAEARAGLSDGYHTFAELYEHRHALFAALCRSTREYSWKSRLHSDGSSYHGWFIAGINEEKGEQITYHVPLKHWKAFDVEELDKAPDFDGHTAKDVLRRLARVWKRWVK